MWVCIRPHVRGARRNWLLAGSDDGDKHTAKLYGWNFESYLRHALRSLPGRP